MGQQRASVKLCVSLHVCRRSLMSMQTRNSPGFVSAKGSGELQATGELRSRCAYLRGACRVAMKSTVPYASGRAILATPCRGPSWRGDASSKLSLPPQISRLAPCQLRDLDLSHHSLGDRQLRAKAPLPLEELNSLPLTSCLGEPSLISAREELCSLLHHFVRVEKVCYTSLLAQPTLC